MYVSMRLPMALVAVAAAAAVFHGAATAVVLAGTGAVLLALAVDAVVAPSPRTLRVERDVSATLGMNRRSPVALRLHNPTSRRLEVAVRDATPPSLDRRPKRHRATIPAGGWTTLTAEVRPGRRGYAVFGPMAVRTSGPLGLGGRQATLKATHRVKVYPALPSRAEVEIRLRRARLLEMGERSSAIRGGGTDFDSLREYHPDDEFRRINWRATARAAKPITNLYREERNQQVVLLLDASRTMAASLRGFSRFEHALDAAFAVAELAVRVGDQVGMLAFAAAVLARSAPRGGRAQPRRLLDTLFDLEPSLEAANYREAFAALLARQRRRALLVLLTELTEESAQEPLFEAVPALLSRHLMIVGTVSDPEVARLGGLVPASSEEAYEKAAAAAALDARARAVGRLGRMGAVVVDAPPGALAGQLADRYLRIKAQGRL